MAKKKEKERFIYELRDKTTGRLVRKKAWSGPGYLRAFLARFRVTRWSAIHDLKRNVFEVVEKERVKSNYEIVEMKIVPSRVIPMAEFYPQIDELK